MSAHTLVLLLLNFGFIGVLPVIFFKKGGRFNLRWWLTAAPLFGSASMLVIDFFRLAPALHFFPPSFANGGLEGIFLTAGPMELAAIVSAAASIALIAYTLGTHRGPVSLWHQANNLPDRLVTWGAYQRIRHPFYTAFLLALVGAFLASPQLGTLLALVSGVLVLNYTASREEQQLLASPFGSQYAEYRRRTGRFWPRPGWRPE